MNKLKSSIYINAFVKLHKLMLSKDYVNQIDETTQRVIIDDYCSLVSNFAVTSSKYREIIECYHVALKSRIVKSMNKIEDMIATFMISDEDNIVTCYTELINLTQRLINLLKGIETFRLRKSYIFRKTKIVEIKFEETSQLEEMNVLLRERDIRLVSDRNEAMELYPEMFDVVELQRISDFLKNLNTVYGHII